MIAIVDYGMGNIGSVVNMLRKVGAECASTSDPDILRSAKKLILPGVGAFDRGMQNLHERGLVKLLDELVLEKKTPILGICLGMQLLSKGSEEGERPGLGWIPARTIRFPGDVGGAILKVPHMGWHEVTARATSRLFHPWEDGRPTRFYFVHSYHVVCEDPQLASSHGSYGIPFCASVERDHVFGVQFHPEKSHKFGMQLLKNFAELP